MNVRKIQRSYQPLLSLQINTVAAAVHTTAASAVADAFVIVVVVVVVVVVVAIAANVAVIADYRTVYVTLRHGPDSISKGIRKRHTQHYNSNYLIIIIIITTTKRKTKTYTVKYNARHCYEPLDDQNNRNAIIKCDKKNILEKYKCVVCKINKNTINSTKALTRNNENTDFKDTRLSEIASNVPKMEITLNISPSVERHDADVDRGVSVSGNYNHNVTTKSNTKCSAFLTLPFLTVFWLSICGFATSLFNIQAFAAKMLRLQESLVLCGITGNNNQHHGKPSGGSPLVLSLLTQLPMRKSLPPRLPRTAAAAASTSLVGSDLCASSFTSMISAPQTRVPFTISYVFYAMFILFLLPTVHSDDGDNFFLVNTFSMSPETTTPQFDYASRGQKKFGDKCENTLECGFPGSICDAKKKSCQCTEDLPVTNHIDKCGKEAAVNESCFFNEQCEVKHYQTECRDGRCACRYEMMPFWGKDGTVECKGRGDKRGPETYIDPAMIGVLVGMALMFIIICVVLRLFSQARWRENRTIFNTPNPRLMNVSLLRDGKLLHGQERRGSRMSVRAPSRQPSMASLRPHSPNPSLGKTGSHSGSASVSNASATSIRSTRSNSVAPGNVANIGQLERKGSQYHNQHQHQHPHHQQQQQQQQMPLITNITANPAAESVAVEIIVPEK